MLLTGLELGLSTKGSQPARKTPSSSRRDRACPASRRPTAQKNGVPRRCSRPAGPRAAHAPRRLWQALPAAGAQGPAGHPPPASDLPDGGHSAGQHEAADDDLAPGPAPGCPVQARHLGDGAEVPVGRELQHGWDALPQAEAGAVGTRRQPAAARRGAGCGAGMAARGALVRRGCCRGVREADCARQPTVPGGGQGRGETPGLLGGHAAGECPALAARHVPRLRTPGRYLAACADRSDRRSQLRDCGK